VAVVEAVADTVAMAVVVAAMTTREVAIASTVTMMLLVMVNNLLTKAVPPADTLEFSLPRVPTVLPIPMRLVSILRLLQTLRDMG
jgi:hypothetical protein